MFSISCLCLQQTSATKAIVRRYLAGLTNFSKFSRTTLTWNKSGHSDANAPGDLRHRPTAIVEVKFYE